VETGRKLGLGYVLEGSLEFDDDQLQASVRLIDIAAGRLQLSERFVRPKEEVAKLQEDIVERLASFLAQDPTSDLASPHSSHPQSTEAYLLQLQARANLKLFGRLPTMKAVGLFERALQLDPAYALAHAGLAATYLQLTSTTLARPLPIEEGIPLARQSAERALALDSTLAEAWMTLGRVKIYEWDWDAAEAMLAHAVVLNPSAVEALTQYGQFLSSMGRHNGAIDVTERALELSPRRVRTLFFLATVYWMAGANERALETLREILNIQPKTYMTHRFCMLILDYLGRHEEAMWHRIAEFRQELVAQSIIEQFMELQRRRAWPVAIAAWANMREQTNPECASLQWLAIGETTRAYQCLTRSLLTRGTYLPFLAVAPPWRSLHSDPRFQQALRTLKLEGLVSDERVSAAYA
jgi:tetratricopeptide (TPR) repeat protein